MDAESFHRLQRALTGRIVDHKYEILAGLGYGTFGAVFLGYEHLKKRFVALKRVVVGRDDLTAVTQEIEGLEVLADSRNVVQYLGYSIEEPSPNDTAADPAFMADKLYFYLVMEFGGTSLEPYLQRFGAEAHRDTKDEAFFRGNEMLSTAIMKDVLAGLRDAHACRVVHRDIKPANIYLGLDTAVKLGDFGVAKQLMQEGAAQGTIVGTVSYMAPEQIAGEEYDVNVDIFSAGIVFYRMLTGRMPFANLVQIRTKDPDLAQPGIFPGMDAILAKALARDPAVRYRSADEMIYDLEDYEVGLEPVGLTELLARFRDNIQDLLSPHVRRLLERPPRDRLSTTPRAGVSLDPEATRIGSAPGTATPVAPPRTEPDATRIGAPPPDEPKIVDPGTPAPDEELEGTRILTTGDLRAGTQEPAAPVAPSPPSVKAPPPVPPPPRDPMPFESTPIESSTVDAPPGESASPQRSRRGPSPVLIGGVAAALLVVVAIAAYFLVPRSNELRIFCDQPARVYVNGEEKGTVPDSGPLNVTVPAGSEIRVRLVATGYEEFEATLPPGKTILDAKLTAKAETPVLVVSVNLRDVILRAGARVITDPPTAERGRFVWTLTDLPPGRTSVTAELPGTDYAPAEGAVTLEGGKRAELRLDLAPKQAVAVSVSVTDERGRAVAGYTLTVNGEKADVAPSGRVAGDFSEGGELDVRVAARGYKDWSRTVTIDDADFRIAAVLTGLSRGPRGPREPAAPAGSIRVSSTPAGIVFVNWTECGATPATCKVDPSKSTEVFVVNYKAKKAYYHAFRKGKAPRSLRAKLDPCTRNLVMDWKPWAYVNLSDHKGRKVALSVSGVEARPQTPKRVSDLACGCYRVMFSNADGLLATKWAWVRPNDPGTVRVGKF